MSILSANFTSLGMCQADLLRHFLQFPLLFSDCSPPVRRTNPWRRCAHSFHSILSRFGRLLDPKKKSDSYDFFISLVKAEAPPVLQALRPFCPACLRNGSALERMPNGTISLRFVQAWILVTCILQNRFGTGTSGILTMSYAHVCWNLWTYVFF